MKKEIDDWFTVADPRHSLHFLYYPDSTEIAAYYAYGHFDPGLFAATISQETGHQFCADEVRHEHVLEVAGDDGLIQHPCDPLQPYHALITLLEV